MEPGDRGKVEAFVDPPLQDGLRLGRDLTGVVGGQAVETGRKSPGIGDDSAGMSPQKCFPDFLSSRFATTPHEQAGRATFVPDEVHQIEV